VATSNQASVLGVKASVMRETLRGPGDNAMSVFPRISADHSHARVRVS
jgi:hypothetical protein